MATKDEGNASASGGGMNLFGSPGFTYRAYGGIVVGAQAGLFVGLLKSFGTSAENLQELLSTHKLRTLRTTTRWSLIGAITGLGYVIGIDALTDIRGKDDAANHFAMGFAASTPFSFLRGGGTQILGRGILFGGICALLSEVFNKENRGWYFDTTHQGHCRYPEIYAAMEALDRKCKSTSEYVKNVYEK